MSAGKEQRAFLAMQVGKFRFQIDVVMCVATDIARAARSRPDIVQRLFHGLHDRGMLPHGEIIVGAPHRDRVWPIMSGKAARLGKGTLVAQYVNEHAVATLGVTSIDRLRNIVLLVHGMLCPTSNLSVPGPLASMSEQRRLGK